MHVPTVCLFFYTVVVFYEFSLLITTNNRQSMELYTCTCIRYLISCLLITISQFDIEFYRVCNDQYTTLDLEDSGIFQYSMLLSETVTLHML